MNINVGELYPIDLKNLPPPGIQSLPQKGDFRLLPCGATASIAIDHGEQQQLVGAANMEQFRVISDDIVRTKPFFVVRRSQEAARIADHLEKQGVAVERLRKNFGDLPISLNADEYISERLGDADLQKSLSSCRIDQRPIALRNYANLLGRVHLTGVVYGNNHLGNVVSNDELNLSLVDFKTSSLVDFDWGNASAVTVWKTFFADLAPLQSNLRSIGCSDQEIADTLRAVVENYPLSTEEKASLLQLMASV